MSEEHYIQMVELIESLKSYPTTLHISPDFEVKPMLPGPSEEHKATCARLDVIIQLLHAILRK